MLIIFVAIVTILLLTYLFRHKYTRKIELKDMHFLITGGSSGIGLAFAIQVARYGGNVTIIARDKVRLDMAKYLIQAEAKNKSQKILAFSSDVSNKEDTLKELVREAELEAGPVNMLLNCAGTSVCYPILETPIDDFSRMLNVNYLGSVYMTRAVLPSMMKQKKGSIVYVASIAGLMGLYGYTAYSASKFALVGLAESLQMEIKAHNISVTVAFPPDTDTPGFAEEVKNKPIETTKISETSGIYSPEDVASTILKDSLNKKFMSTVGFDGYVVATLCSGMKPVRSFVELVSQVMTMGLFRLASCFILFQFDRIIQKCADEKKSLSKQKINNDAS